jgi:hypothetical protein
MDRGVKIAIFVASIVSLALGLIWDQVLNQARTVAQDRTINVDELGPDLISAVVGPPEVPRLQPPEGFEVRPPEPGVTPSDPESEGDAQPVDNQPSSASGWLSYVLKPNDSAAKLAHKLFPERGLESKDILDANPESKWRVGDTVRIPPSKGARPPAPSIIPPPPTAASTPRAQREPIIYEVQANDGWWVIADKFKERGLSWQEIEAANPDIKQLKPGMKVKIP